VGGKEGVPIGAARRIGGVRYLPVYTGFSLITERRPRENLDYMSKLYQEHDSPGEVPYRWAGAWVARWGGPWGNGWARRCKSIMYGGRIWIVCQALPCLGFSSPVGMSVGGEVGRPVGVEVGRPVG
jgi:hypothetical protein